jgi:hypothetical protein
MILHSSILYSNEAKVISMPALVATKCEAGSPDPSGSKTNAKQEVSPTVPDLHFSCP